MTTISGPETINPLAESPDNGEQRLKNPIKENVKHVDDDMSKDVISRKFIEHRIRWTK